MSLKNTGHGAEVIEELRNEVGLSRPSRNHKRRHCHVLLLKQRVSRLHLMSREPALTNLRIQQIFHNGRKDVPLLRKGIADLVYQNKPVLHDHDVLPFSRTLVARRKGCPQVLLDVTESKELLHHGRSHLRASIRSNDIWDPSRSHHACD